MAEKLPNEFDEGRRGSVGGGGGGGGLIFGQNASYSRTVPTCIWKQGEVSPDCMNAEAGLGPKHTLMGIFFST